MWIISYISNMQTQTHTFVLWDLNIMYCYAHAPSISGLTTVLIFKFFLGRVILKCNHKTDIIYILAKITCTVFFVFEEKYFKNLHLKSVFTYKYIYLLMKCLKYIVFVSTLVIMWLHLVTIQKQCSFPPNGQFGRLFWASQTNLFTNNAKKN